MIVYGDQKRHENPRHLITELQSSLELLATCGSGTMKDRTNSLLIACGEVAQGLLDEQFYAFDEDEWTPLAEHCARLTRSAAELAIDGYQTESAAGLEHELECIRSLHLPESIVIKTPEGYAHYAVYPELYALAAARIVEQCGPTLVIGLRSIGTSLAAVVAHRLASIVLPITLRPAGHPYNRTLKVGPKLRERLLDNSLGRYAVVDEGPGLSGSSFMAVADWLMQQGVQPEQLDFFPSHQGEPGFQASAAHRSLWQTSRKNVFTFEAIESRLMAEVFGHPASQQGCPAWQELSGGKWRELLFDRGSAWPPCNLLQERRKYLLPAEQPVLAKFAGLGHYGEAQFARAERLSSARLIPHAREQRSGFILTDWLTDAVPLLAPRTLAASARSALLEQVAEYLKYLAIHFPASQAGADTTALYKMATFNLSQYGWRELQMSLAKYIDQLHAFNTMARPVNTDNKMQSWEWLRLADGEWRKADAIEHHCDHCCVGAQDIAWDVAGAICELELNEEESKWLIEQLIPHSGICRSEMAFGFYQSCYSAFQIGYCTLSSQSQADFIIESTRFAERANSYAKRLLAATR